MNADRKHFGAPSAAELAAHLDGELPVELALRVERWLDENPELAAELEAQCELTQTYQDYTVPEPTPEEWDLTLQRIETALAQPTTRVSVVPAAPNPVDPRRSNSRWLRWPAAAAAVVLLALLNSHNPAHRGTAAIEPFPVATADEVDILSVHGQDISMLVIGRVPLHEPLALATVHDVTVENMQPDADGMMPDATASNSTSPMIVAPLNGGVPAERAP